MPTRTQANSYLIPTHTLTNSYLLPTRTQTISYQIPTRTQANCIELLLLCNILYKQEHSTCENTAHVCHLITTASPVSSVNQSWCYTHPQMSQS